MELFFPRERWWLCIDSPSPLLASFTCLFVRCGDLSLPISAVFQNVIGSSKKAVQGIRSWLPLSLNEWLYGVTRSSGEGADSYVGISFLWLGMRSNPVSYNLERKCREACWRHSHSPSDSSTSLAVLGFLSPGVFFSDLKFRPSVVSHSQACGYSRRWAVTHSWLTWPALLSFQWIKQMNETIRSTFCKVKLMKGE